MNPIKRIWQWVRERRGARHAGKDSDGGRRHRSQDVPPLVGSAADPRLRLLKNDPGPRIV
jgi:hypothetical protein